MRFDGEFAGGEDAGDVFVRKSASSTPPRTPSSSRGEKKAKPSAKKSAPLPSMAAFKANGRVQNPGIDDKKPAAQASAMDRAISGQFLRISPSLV